MSLKEQRREYVTDGLSRSDLADSPFEQFNNWMQAALQSGISDPTAVVVSTVGKNGRPWSRIVLLKHADQKGFVFYTNVGSRKAKEIAANAGVCLLFPWHGMERQVIVGGVARKITTRETAAYFLSRPRESQLAAWASRQSSALDSRQLLEAQFARMKRKFGRGEIPLPDFWVGFRVEPEEFEFWQGGKNRLHDRFHYRRAENDEGAWQIDRLAP